MIEVKHIIDIFRTKLKSGDNKDLASNTLSLTVLNFFNFVLPLFTIPYLLNKLGAEAYGAVNIYISLYAIFQKVVDYGFNYVGTRNISISDNPSKWNETFTVITICKTTNALLIFIISLIYFLITKTPNYAVALIVSSELIGTAININWLFQGLKKMQIITWITSITKIVYSILIFLLISSPDDILIYAWLYTLISIGIGVIGIVVARSRKFSLKFVKIKIADVIDSYKEGWHMFVASLCGGLTTNLSTVVLGALKGEEAVGFFSAGYKIVQALSLVFSAITQALYPFSCSKFKTSFTEGKRYVYKIMKPVMLLIGISCLLLSASSKLIFTLIYDEVYWPYYMVVVIGAGWLFLSFLNNFLGFQMLVAGGYSSKYRSMFTISTIITIGLYYVLIPFMGEYGSVLALLLGELVLSVILKIQIDKIVKLQTGI